MRRFNHRGGTLKTIAGAIGHALRRVGRLFKSAALELVQLVVGEVDGIRLRRILHRAYDRSYEKLSAMNSAPENIDVEFHVVFEEEYTDLCRYDRPPEGGKIYFLHTVDVRPGIRTLGELIKGDPEHERYLEFLRKRGIEHARLRDLED